MGNQATVVGRAAVAAACRRSVWRAYLGAAVKVAECGGAGDDPQALAACGKAVGAIEAANSVLRATGMPQLESSAVWQAAWSLVNKRVNGSQSAA